MADFNEFGDRLIITGDDGTNDNDVLIQTGDISKYGSFFLMSTQGAMDVFVSIDGTNYTTAPLSLIDLGATTTAPVLVTVANRLYAFPAKVRYVRVLQNGATAALNPSMFCAP